MVKKDAYWNGVLYILFFLMIGWGCMVGYQKVGQGVQHVMHVRSFEENHVAKEDMQPQAVTATTTVATESTIATAIKTSQSSNPDHAASQKAANQPVHARDIIKGKKDSLTKDDTKTRGQSETQDTQDTPDATNGTPSTSSVQESSTDLNASKQQAMTIGTMVERAGLGIGIFVKKETRNALDGLYKIIEQNRVQ
jgi:hypothetical protein